MSSTAGPKRFRSLDDFETLRLLASKLGEGIYISDPGGVILDANPAFLQIVGVQSFEELGHRSAEQLYADPSRRAVWAEKVAREGSVRDFEWELVRPDGERRTVVDTSYTITDPETGEQFHLGILVDISARIALERQLREQLTRDALTGCYNRRFLLDLGARLQRDDGASWGCIFLDIDHFKQYNDQHGHYEGDLVLSRMARFLMRQVRADEPVIRMGGDEFLVVLLGDSAARTGEVAHRLQQAAARSAPVAFSLGWAIRVAGEDLDATIGRADRSMIAVRVLSRSGDHPRLPDEMERRHVPTP